MGGPKLKKPTLAEQIGEVRLIRERYKKRAGDLYAKGENVELAGKLSATADTLAHAIDSLERMERLEKILRQMVNEEL